MHARCLKTVKGVLWLLMMAASIHRRRRRWKQPSVVRMMSRRRSNREAKREREREGLMATTVLVEKEREKHPPTIQPRFTNLLAVTTKMPSQETGEGGSHANSPFFWDVLSPRERKRKNEKKKHLQKNFFIVALSECFLVELRSSREKKADLQ